MLKNRLTEALPRRKETKEEAFWLYRMILIDDDVGTSDNLGNYFPWEENGFHIAEKFYDGAAAFQYLLKHTVDLIISDIKMPEMNGLELAHRLHDMHRPEKILFISGYKDFDYAQQAMEYGVRFYCLKPVTYREIKQKLAQIREELDAHGQNGAEENALPAENGLRDVQIRKVKDYVRANFKNATLASAADYMQMNQCYLSRLFREQTGEKISEFMTRVRMQRALEILQKDDCRSIYEVSSQVGYTNPVSFAKSFCRTYGVTPTAYRKDFNNLLLKGTDHETV